MNDLPNILNYSLLNKAEFLKAVQKPCVMILPLSAPENHGDHLPLGTDYIIAEALAKRISDFFAQQNPEWNVLIHPVWPLGGATIRGAGSLKVRYWMLRKLLVSYGSRICSQGIRGLVIVSGHGGVGHVMAIEDACKILNRRYSSMGFQAIAPGAKLATKVYAGHYVSRWADVGVRISDSIANDLAVDLHAGFLETSIMKFLLPQYYENKNWSMPEKLIAHRPWWMAIMGNFFVSLIKWLPFSSERRDEIIFGIQLGATDLAWVLQGRKEGYLGDPAVSDPNVGRVLLDTMAEDFAQIMHQVFLLGKNPKTFFSFIGYIRPALWICLIIFLGLAALITCFL